MHRDIKPDNILVKSKDNLQYERKRERKLCLPPSFWNSEKLRSISESNHIESN